MSGTHYNRTIALSTGSVSLHGVDRIDDVTSGEVNGTTYTSFWIVSADGQYRQVSLWGVSPADLVTAFSEAQ